MLEGSQPDESEVDKYKNKKLTNFVINTNFRRVSKSIIAKFYELHVSRLGHLTDKGFIHGLSPLTSPCKLVGPALTVRIPQLDSTAVHLALDFAQPGDVIVVSTGGETKRACWGGLVSYYAKKKGIAGAIIDGPICDIEEIKSLGFKVFSRGHSALTTRLLGGLYLGSVIGAIITGYIAATIGWEWAFFIFGLLGLLTSFLWWKYFRDDPKDNKYLTEEEKKILGSQEDSLPPKTQAAQWKVFFKSYQFWAIGIQYLFLIMIQSFYTTLLPTYLYTYKNIRIAEVGELTALPWAALFITVFIIGYVEKYVLKKTGSVYYARVPFAITGFLLAIVFLYLAMIQSNVYDAIYLMMISMAGIGFVQVTIWSSCQDLGQRYTASVTGWVNMWGNIASALGPLFTAFLVTIGTSFSNSVIIIGLSGIVGIVAWLFVKPHKPLYIEGKL